MYLATLAQMNTLQESRLSAVGRTATQRLKLGQDPVTKASGLYWIWTNYTDAELLAAVPSPKRASIDIAGLTARQQNLASICRRNSGDFRLVYNGIGGQATAGHGGLRERILEEFRAERARDHWPFSLAPSTTSRAGATRGFVGTRSRGHRRRSSTRRIAR